MKPQAKHQVLILNLSSINLPQSQGRSRKKWASTEHSTHSKVHGTKASLITVTKYFFIATGSKSKPARVKMIVKAVFLKKRNKLSLTVFCSLHLFWIHLKLNHDIKLICSSLNFKSVVSFNGAYLLSNEGYRLQTNYNF